MKKQHFLRILALILLAAGLLSGCSTKKRRPTSTFHTSSTSAQKKDAGARLKSYLKSASPEEAPDTLGAQLEQVLAEASTLKVKQSDDKTAQVEITAPDISALASEILASGGGPEALLEALKTGTYPTKVTELTLEIDENGHPADSWAFADAMYGGLLTYLEQLMGEMEAAA